MPARKPLVLIDSDATLESRQAREAMEKAMTPKTPLPRKPPAALKGHNHAMATWERLMQLYSAVDGAIVNALDRDILIKYCMAEEELIELYRVLGDIKKIWHTYSHWLASLKPKPDQLKMYANVLGHANMLLQRLEKMDARIDGKRKLIIELAQSLYLTPRSRAGVAPPEKSPEETDSELNRLLDEGN